MVATVLSAFLVATTVSAILMNITADTFAAGQVNNMLACDDLGSCGAPPGTGVCSY